MKKKRVSVCQYCYDRIPDYLFIECRQCHTVEMIKREDYIMKHFDTLSKKPANIAIINQNAPVFVITRECDRCMAFRIGWIIEETSDAKNLPSM